MQRTSSKLALIAALAVALAMVAATCAFNLFIGWKIETDATKSIEYALDLGNGDGSAGSTPNYITLDTSYRIDAAERRWSTENERKLAAWFSEHPEENVVNRVTIDGWTCYAAITPYLQDEYYDPRTGTGTIDMSPAGFLIAYIDTASEQSLIFSVNMAFAAIAFLGIALAAFAGYTAGRQIEEATDAQKRFYENMSHELKTPLAAIRGFAEGATGGVMDTEEAMRAISKETTRAAEMIDEILGLSKLEAKTVQPHKERIALEDFVQDCLMPFEGSVRAKGLNVKLDLEKAGAIDADPDLFEHALTNVLTNAVRHAKTVIRIRCKDGELAVFNDGNAPSSEQLEHLFDRFYTGEGGSTGIGLAIAKEIATLHGWKIVAHARDNGFEIAFMF